MFTLRVKASVKFNYLVSEVNKKVLLTQYMQQ